MIPVPNKGEDSMRRFITWMSSLLLVFLLAACIEPEDPVTDPNILYPSGSTIPCQTPPPTLVHFGTYPQTLASEQAVALMSDTPGVDGYYTSSYDNERYAKVIADPYAATYTFTNGDAIDVGTPSPIWFSISVRSTIRRTTGLRPIFGTGSMTPSTTPPSCPQNNKKSLRRLWSMIPPVHP
jgi:hypothetical protein